MLGLAWTCDWLGCSARLVQAYPTLARWLGWTWDEYRAYVERGVLSPRRRLAL